MRAKKRRDYSKNMTTIMASVFSALAVGFIIFVCYEMHRQNDLSPVAYLGPSIAGILASIVGFYMWRAKAKSQNDLEWEQTKQLTLFRNKHPEAFTRGSLHVEEEEDTIGGMG